MKIKLRTTVLFLLVIPFIGILFYAVLHIYFTIINKPVSPKYNLILISIDTLRPDHMGIYGYRNNTTPNIDKWAKDAFVYTNAYTVVPQTFPSFATLFTGLHPFSTRIISSSLYNPSNPLSDNSLTLPKVLHENGYFTGAFLNNAIFDPLVSNFDKGFDTYKINEFRYCMLSSEDKKNKDKDNECDRDNDEQVVKNSINWMAQNSNKKIFLWVHLLGSHYPYTPLLQNKCRFNQSLCGTIEKLTNDQIEKKRVSLEQCQPKGINQLDLEIMSTLYDAKIYESDNKVGILLTKIKELGLDKNSIIMIYGDHGEGFDHNYFFNHGNVLYDSAVKIPLIIKYPDIFLKKLVVDSNIDNTDIFRLLLNLLKIKSEDISKSHENSTDVLKIKNSNDYDNESKNKRIFLTNNEFSKFAIIDGKYKYIYSMSNSCLMNDQKEEFYDLYVDKNELNNLISIKKETAAKLKLLLLTELSKYNLPLYEGSKSKERSKELYEIIDKIKSLGY